MSTRVPTKFAKAISDAAESAGVSILDVLEEALLMTPDGYLLRAEAQDTTSIAEALPSDLLDVLDDMAKEFGFTREGLLLEMAGYVHKAAAALIAHDEERAREVRKRGRS